jgi:hypothetical protein
MTTWKERFDRLYTRDCRIDTLHCGVLTCDIHYGFLDQLKEDIEKEMSEKNTSLTIIQNEKL